jgi:GT2 family glycosyltransferase
MAETVQPVVSIVIPVLNKVEFTRQCLDRIWRNTADVGSLEVIIVDNGSVDGTAAWFQEAPRFPHPLRYHRNATNLGFAKGNNLGADIALGEYLLFLNNDTLVQPGWLSEMLRVIRSDKAIGIVGIKQLFPYTNTIYHTGVVFAPGGIPQHLYPHLDASLPYVNQEREYQAVNGACLLIGRRLFEACGKFDESYVNGYEDTDLCMTVRQQGRKVVCCTSAYIYHYGQTSEGRTARDDENAKRFADKWGRLVRVDQHEYAVKDRIAAPRESPSVPRRSLAPDCFYFADDLAESSAFTWVNVQLALSLADLGAPVFVNGGRLASSVESTSRKRINQLALTGPVIGGVQAKFSHYWPRHLNLELNGDLNLEFFVINYLFGRPNSEPWDHWLQSVRHNHHVKLPVSEFCQSVVNQLAPVAGSGYVLHHGFSPEVHEVDLPSRTSDDFRFLTITNSHDLGRYNTAAILAAYDRAFADRQDVVLVIKDYGAASGNTTLRESLRQRPRRPRVEYISEFVDKRALIRLYKSSDAFVSAHRGEGFGMKILDAMACGLPVITPLFGGPTSYCTTDNCVPIDFSLVPVTDCVDSQSLRPTNEPLWAEASAESLERQMRSVYERREWARAVGSRGRSDVLERFSWQQIATNLVRIATDLGTSRHQAGRRLESTVSHQELSPYWLGTRVSVVIPTHNRKEKLLACLDALAKQSVLPQEFEVIAIDDGSSDETREALANRDFPFAFTYLRQDRQGPGAARNLGIARSSGGLVLFIGDDVIADKRLVEHHLEAHARNPDIGVAILGHIDWPSEMPRNAVMDYVCGDAALQFAYTLIPHLPELDHRFFYTSNISLKRQFLIDAADAGVRFDPSFTHAAFEDAEFAFRLIPRGLRIRYVSQARAFHDHWLDLESFADREFRAGQMAVVFYRQHPGQDEQLQVSWMEELSAPAAALLKYPELLQHLENFDRQTDGLLRALVGTLEELTAIDSKRRSDVSRLLSTDKMQLTVHGLLRMIFDTHRTRGKVQEWFAGVDDAATVRAAQTLASARRKIGLLTGEPGAPGLQAMMSGLDSSMVDGLSERMNSLGHTPRSPDTRALPRKFVRDVIGRVAGNSIVAGRLIAVDHFLQSRLQGSGRKKWLDRYRKLRRTVRHALM